MIFLPSPTGKQMQVEILGGHKVRDLVAVIFVLDRADTFAECAVCGDKKGSSTGINHAKTRRTQRRARESAL
jgi:hypothetical protein